MTAAGRAYRLALRAYPPDYRRERGPEILATLGEMQGRPWRARRAPARRRWSRPAWPSASRRITGGARGGMWAEGCALARPPAPVAGGAGVRIRARVGHLVCASGHALADRRLHPLASGGRGPRPRAHRHPPAVGGGARDLPRPAAGRTRRAARGDGALPERRRSGSPVPPATRPGRPGSRGSRMPTASGRRRSWRPRPRSSGWRVAPVGGAALADRSPGWPCRRCSRSCTSALLATTVTFWPLGALVAGVVPGRSLEPAPGGRGVRVCSSRCSPSCSRPRSARRSTSTPSPSPPVRPCSPSPRWPRRSRSRRTPSSTGRAV